MIHGQGDYSYGYVGRMGRGSHRIFPVLTMLPIICALCCMDELRVDIGNLVWRSDVFLARAELSITRTKPEVSEVPLTNDLGSLV